jgi:hypothetical protein
VPSEVLVKEYDRIFKPEYIDEGMEKPDFDELLYKAQKEQEMLSKKTT